MKTRKFWMICLLTMVSLNNYGQDTNLFFREANSIFKLHVKEGRVDYKKIQSNPEKLNKTLDLAKNISVPKNDISTYQAFWINVYNLCVIKGVIDNYPINSPLEVPGFFDKKTYYVGNKERTLNEIENELLRANFPKEPRFHFVLVCAGLGCPPIIDKAYLPQTLEMQLQNQTELSLNNPNFIRVNENEVGISQIFEWYASDFKQGDKNFIEFLNTYRKNKLNPSSKVSFYPYDWSLNILE
ncbi:MAG: DUF547 domain-containing protein [Muricauda sp.]|nr:DUF547 domain-containing protein [uncultured Allomuricauda sp.]MBC74283.1 DUF547 domain-containing protein [Allomuricauda sp.]